MLFSYTLTRWQQSWASVCCLKVFWNCQEHTLYIYYHVHPRCQCEQLFFSLRSCRRHTVLCCYVTVLQLPIITGWTWFFRKIPNLSNPGAIQYYSMIDCKSTSYSGILNLIRSNKPFKKKPKNKRMKERASFSDTSTFPGLSMCM